MLGVINYGAGNFRSLCNALNFLKIPYSEISKSEDFENVSHIILPGVGAFNDCIDRLESLGITGRLKSEIINGKKFFLGICVGHQILSSLGTEFEEKEGLNLIPGKTIKLESSKNLPVPHIGWSEVNQVKKSGLFTDIEDGATFYFVHSFYIDVKCDDDVLASVSYGRNITAAVAKNNIFGVQFHPEKSQTNGLQLLKNFSELKDTDIS